jgi:hypothetical protein
VTGAFDHRRSLGLRRLGLFCIFGLQGLGFLAKGLGFVELLADRVDLLVERLADRGRDLLPDHDREDRQHGQRDPHRSGDPEQRRLGMLRRRGSVGLGHGLRLSHWLPP